MAKDYKRYGKTGQFRKPLIGDATGPLRRQAEQVGESLRKSQIRTDEYGRDYVRGLEKTHSNLLNNFETNKQLTDAIFKTREWATALKGQREVEYLKSVADEYGKKAAYWEDFSTTQFHKYWKAATYIYDEVEKRKQAKQIREDEQSTDKQANLVETITSTADQEEKRLTQEAIRTQRLGDYTATKYTTGLARRKLQPIIADNLANRIIRDTSIQYKFESRLEEESKHTTNPLILNSDTVYSLYVDNAYRILKETGIKETSPAGQKILNHWFELGGNKKRKLYNEEQVGIGQTNVLDAFTEFKNADSKRKPQLLENLVTTVMNAWEYDEKAKQFITNKDKDNRHTDGWIPTFKYLIDNDYYTGDGGEVRLLEDFKHIVWDENGPTGVEFGTKFSKQGTREELLKYLRANNKSKLTSIENDRRATQDQETLNLHSYVQGLPDGLSSLSAEEDIYNKFIRGRALDDPTALAARTLINYNKSDAKWETHRDLKKAWEQGDTLEFMSHYYTLSAKERPRYSHMITTIKNMQNDWGGSSDVFTENRNWAEEHVTQKLLDLVPSEAVSKVSQLHLAKGTDLLLQFQISAYNELEGKATGTARIQRSRKLAIDEFSKIEVIGVLDKRNINKTQNYFAPWFESVDVGTNQISEEMLMSELMNPEVEKVLSNPEDYPSSAVRAAQKSPVDNTIINTLLEKPTLISKTVANSIVVGIANGTDVLTMPKNISIIYANSNKSRTQTELLNYALKAQGYTTKDNLIPLNQVDLLQKKWPNKIAGISPRHWKKLAPFFLIDGRQQLQGAN